MSIYVKFTNFDVLKFPIFEIFQKSKLKGAPIRAHVFSSACSNKLADSTQSGWQRGHERLEIGKIYNYVIFSKLIQSLRRWRISLVIKIARPHPIFSAKFRTVMHKNLIKIVSFFLQLDYQVTSSKFLSSLSQNVSLLAFTVYFANCSAQNFFAFSSRK